MSVKRRDLLCYLEENGFTLVREGGNHSIYSDGVKVVPVKRHRVLDRITANPRAAGGGGDAGVAGGLPRSFRKLLTPPGRAELQLGSWSGTRASSPPPIAQQNP
jgi:predicted RNA binding protein YcfA (HicA-like mRNA interferase family)